MAIRIGRETIPQPGRITLPRGTFLSNPSTAADGALGGGAGMNPGTPQVPQVPTGPQVNMWQGVTPGYNSVQYPMAGVTDPNPYARYQRTENLFQMSNRVFPVPHLPGASGQEQNAAANFLNNLFFTPQKSASDAFANPSQVGNTTSLVGRGPTPGMLSDATLAQMFPNVPLTQREDFLRTRGYIKSYQPGLGTVWVQGNGSADTSTLANSMPTDARGRPYDVTGENLQPGERVTAASGVRYVGGTPTADGTGQYAITLPNEAAARDTKGRYKWVSTVQKDARGNWVRVYRQQLRKVYTRSHLKNQAGAGGGAGGGSNGGAVSTNEQSQLVNFRANYG